MRIPTREVETLPSVAPFSDPSPPPSVGSRRGTIARGRERGSQGHRDDIQGLRAVAVLLVVVGHSGVRFLRGGFVGVDVFFVLSGFLITGLLLAGADRRGHVSLREFYARRAKRILPAAALTLIVTDLAADRLLNYVRAKQAVVDSLWAALFSANVHSARVGVDYFAQGQPPSPVQHYWSLAVEEQFYLVWPILLSVVLVGVAIHARRRSPAVSGPGGAAGPHLRTGRLAVVITVAGLASLAWSIRATSRAPAATYFSTAARAWELALGAALAIGAPRFLHLPHRVRALLGWVGVLAIGAAAVLFTDATPFPGSAALLPTVGTALVIAAGIGDERTRWSVGGLLGRSPLRYVGDRSYAFYLWHWPVLVIAAYYAGRTLSVGANLMLMTGAFGLSMLSFRFVENPIRRTRVARPIRASAMLWGASVGLVAVIAALTLHSIAGRSAAASGAAPTGPPPTIAPVSPTSPAIPAVAAAVEAARRGALTPSRLDPPLGRLLDDTYEFPSARCFASRGDPSNRKICPLVTGSTGRTIVVFGDSHARQWLPAVVWTASRDGWTVIPFIELGCGPTRYDNACQPYLQWAIQRVQAMHPEVVLIGGQLKVTSPQLMRDSVAGIAMLVAAVTPFTQDVVVIGDPPAQGHQPVDCLLARGSTLAGCTRTLTADQISVYEEAAAAAVSAGGAFIDTMGWFCFEHQCPMVIGHTVAYRDTTHISKTYALELRAVFRDAFDRALSG